MQNIWLAELTQASLSLRSSTVAEEEFEVVWSEMVDDKEEITVWNIHKQH